MAIPTSMVQDLRSRRKAGIVLGICPTTGTPVARFEIRRSTQSSTASTAWTSIFIDPTSETYRYAIELAYSTRLSYFQVRRVLAGYTASSWSTVASARPRYLADLLRGPIRSELLSDQKFALRATENDGATKVSDAFNGQGSMPPNPVGTVFSYTAGGDASLRMYIAWTWSAFTIYRPDGTTISVPASSSLPAPPSPTLTQVAGGALGARTYFVRLVYCKNGVIYRVGAEASLAVLANNLLKVTSPASSPGMDGWIPIIGTTANNERTGPSGSSNLTDLPTAFGTDWTEPTTGVNTTTGTLYSNANWPNAVVGTNIDVSLTFKYYPYYSIALGFVIFSPKGSTGVSATDAQNQNGDGNIPLSFGPASATTPAAAGSGSGTGGGKYL